jgi:hypothetical protein
MINYTAKYTKIASGFMGQLIEWPEVVTDGKDLEDCRSSLCNAFNEMILVYNELGVKKYHWATPSLNSSP